MTDEESEEGHPDMLGLLFARPAARDAWDKGPYGLLGDLRREQNIRKWADLERYGRRKCSLGKLLDEGMTHIMAVVGG